MAGPSSGEKTKSTIVIKRIKKGGHGGGHSAAWKIAYADFVTAMMAFFLLMWLLGSTTAGDRKGIQDYFQSPLKVALAGGSGAGDATSVIQGGGTNLTMSAGQVKNGDHDSRKHTPYQSRQAQAKLERERMEQLKQRIDAAILANSKLAEYRNQIRVAITPDGLRVQIVDDFDRPMFALGSTRLQPYMREILHEVGQVLNTVDNKVAISGHTDSAQYVGGERGYSNWELSTDRANASRRELVAGGMETTKIVRVVGLADSALLVKDDPRSPLNRRMSIIVLNKIAEERLNRAGGEIEAGSAEDLKDALTPPGGDSDSATPSSDPNDTPESGVPSGAMTNPGAGTAAADASIGAPGSAKSTGETHAAASAPPTTTVARAAVDLPHPVVAQ